ncbi:MAG: exodeoxyribonuclease III [candidate division WOR-3 bacterium]|nr:MAG: exodeoxyribonuclease III [candidate division WOR-3 bacterium]
MPGPKRRKRLRLLSWNVNGIRAAVRKGFLEWFAKDRPDILCVQETKAAPEQVLEPVLEPEGYCSYWNTGERKGYSGVATYSRQEPDSVEYSFGRPEFDREGRLVITEQRGFRLYNVYFPNGKQSRERLKYKLDFYDALLEHLDREAGQGKRLVVCGDYNTAHKEIDLARPKPNERVSGFLPVERKRMDRLVERGFADTFRMFHPDETGQYTWWDLMTRARERNVGWRIDYFFVSQNLRGSVARAFILPEVLGSDHCPAGIELRI